MGLRVHKSSTKTIQNPTRTETAEFREISLRADAFSAQYAYPSLRKDKTMKHPVNGMRLGSQPEQSALWRF